MIHVQSIDPTQRMLKRLSSLRSLVSGVGLLLISATLVNGGNYLFNLLLGRWLGPARFADLSLIITLFLMTSFVTAGLQTPMARSVAVYAATADWQAVANLRRWSLRLAWGLGLGYVLIFALAAPWWRQTFATQSALPFVIFGLLVPFYLLQGVDRGVLQGRIRFGWLAFTYQTEMVSRLLVSGIAVWLGWGVEGAVLGLGLSFVATWWVARQAGQSLPAAQPVEPAARRALIGFTLPVLLAQLGQILINNSDILIVRYFFSAEEAGHYAALALIGRIVFFATWSIVTAIFPMVAQRQQRGEDHRNLLWLALGTVLAGSLLIVAVLSLWPQQIVQLLFGNDYLAIAPLLWGYALSTMCYALANVLVHYRLALDERLGSWLTILAGLAQVIALLLFHATLWQVLWVQIILMASLFVVLLMKQVVGSK